MIQRISVDVEKLASAAAGAAVAYERLGIALRELEDATGIQFLEAVSEEYRNPTRETADKAGQKQ